MSSIKLVTSRLCMTFHLTMIIDSIFYLYLVPSLPDLLFFFLVLNGNNKLVYSIPAWVLSDEGPEKPLKHMKTYLQRKQIVNVKKVPALRSRSD